MSYLIQPNAVERLMAANKRDKSYKSKVENSLAPIYLTNSQYDRLVAICEAPPNASSKVKLAAEELDRDGIILNNIDLRPS